MDACDWVDISHYELAHYSPLQPRLQHRDKVRQPPVPRWRKVHSTVRREQLDRNDLVAEH